MHGMNIKSNSNCSVTHQENLGA